MREGLKRAQIAALFVDRDRRIVSATEDARLVLGPSQIDAGRPLGELRGAVNAAILNALAREVQRTQCPAERIVHLRGGSATYRVRAQPDRIRSGPTGGVALILTDVTGLPATPRQSETERRAAQESEAVFLQAPVGLALVDADALILRANAWMARLAAGRPEDLVGQKLDDVLPEHALALAPLVAAVVDERAARHNVALQLEAGSQPSEAFLCDLAPCLAGDALLGVSIAFHDVTEIRQRDDEVQRMMHELQHRVKNILANVMALVRQAQRSRSDPADALVRLAERLQALAQTNNLLSMQNWRAADLADLLRPELTDLYDAERCEIGGPEVLLNARAAVAFAMGVHEMATNAVKYGALSNDTGRVTALWSIETAEDDAELVLRWAEHGGPKVSEPATEGFGSTLVRASFETTLGGQIARRFDPDGIRYEIRVPLNDALAGGAGESDPAPMGSARI